MLENARFCFEQVLEEDPEYPKICEQLAAVCLVLQDHEGFKKYNAMSGDSITLDSLRDTILEMGVDGEQMLRELDDFLKDEKKSSSQQSSTEIIFSSYLINKRLKNSEVLCGKSKKQNYINSI